MANDRLEVKEIFAIYTSYDRTIGSLGYGPGLMISASLSSGLRQIEIFFCNDHQLSTEAMHTTPVAYSEELTKEAT